MVARDIQKSGFLALSVTLGLSLAGCGGGGGGGGGLPVADNILPSEFPAGTTQSIQDYFALGGTWRIDLDGKVQMVGNQSATMADALIYDADLDQWTANVEGSNIVMSYIGLNTYDVGCAQICAQYKPFVTASPTYSTYGYFSYDNWDTATHTAFYVYGGMNTPPADIPTGGTATYAGMTTVVLNYTATSGNLESNTLAGFVDITATFAPYGGVVAFASENIGTFRLAGTAVISGNSYDGTMSGWIQDPNGNTLTLVADGSSLSGAFYGPDQINVGGGETTGVFHATTAAGDPNWGEVAGGFQAAQTSYTAP